MKVTVAKILKYITEHKAYLEKVHDELRADEMGDKNKVELLEVGGKWQALDTLEKYINK